MLSSVKTREFGGPSDVFSCLMVRIKLLAFRLYRAYQKMYVSMHGNGKEPHKTQFRRDEDYGNGSSTLSVLLAWWYELCGTSLIRHDHLSVACSSPLLGYPGF